MYMRLMLLGRQSVPEPLVPKFSVFEVEMGIGQRGGGGKK